MKKVLVLLLTVVLLVASIAGCATSKAPNEGGKQPPGGTDSKDTGDKGITKDNITLRVWHIVTDEKRHEAIKNAIARFQDKYPNIKVEDVPHENDPYKTKLATAMASGEEPDIFITWGGGWLKSFIDEGKVLDIDAKVKEIADQYYEGALSLFEVDGKVYGLPYAVGPSPVYYNKQIYKELGLEVPKTLEEFEKNCEVLKEKGYIPISLANSSQWPGALIFIWLSLRQGGADTFLNAYNRTNNGTFEDESFIKAGQIIQDWVKKGYFNEGFNAMNYDTGAARMLLYSGQAVHMVQTNGFLSVCKSEDEEFYNEKLGIFNFPAIDGGKGTTAEILGGGNGYSIAASTKHPDEAFELIKALTDKEYGQDSMDIAAVISGAKGVTTDDPMLKEMQDLLVNASYVQNYYDQFLPPELGNLHKQTTFDLFDLSTTPEKAAADMEKKAQELLGPSK